MNEFFPDEPIFKLAGNRNGSMLVEMEKPFRYISSKGTITVPIGFISDGTSVPRMFWSIFSPFNGEYFEAALIHDYLYSKASNTNHPDFEREDADNIFKEAMFNLGVHWLKRGTIYRAVRLGGWMSYKEKG